MKEASFVLVDLQMGTTAAGTVTHNSAVGVVPVAKQMATHCHSALTVSLCLKHPADDMA